MTRPRYHHTTIVLALGSHCARAIHGCRPQRMPSSKRMADNRFVGRDGGHQARGCVEQLKNSVSNVCRGPRGPSCKRMAVLERRVRPVRVPVNSSSGASNEETRLQCTGNRLVNLLESWCRPTQSNSLKISTCASSHCVLTAMGGKRRNRYVMLAVAFAAAFAVATT